MHACVLMHMNVRKCAWAKQRLQGCTSPQGTWEALGTYGKSYNFHLWKLDNYPAAVNVPEKPTGNFSLHFNKTIWFL